VATFLADAACELTFFTDPVDFLVTGFFVTDLLTVDVLVDFFWGELFGGTTFFFAVDVFFDEELLLDATFFVGGFTDDFFLVFLLFFVAAMMISPPLIDVYLRAQATPLGMKTQRFRTTDT
jgi:hypothetical protein